jgi:hypothetical protein
MKRDSKKFKHRPLKKDKVHCVCFVFDISTPAEELSEKMQKTFKSLQAWLLDKGNIILDVQRKYLIILSQLNSTELI